MTGFERSMLRKWLGESESDWWPKEDMVGENWLFIRTWEEQLKTSY
jgi:hypothetical protein